MTHPLHGEGVRGEVKNMFFGAIISIGSSNSFGEDLKTKT